MILLSMILSHLLPVLPPPIPMILLSMILSHLRPVWPPHPHDSVVQGVAAKRARRMAEPCAAEPLKAPTHAPAPCAASGPGVVIAAEHCPKET